MRRSVEGVIWLNEPKEYNSVLFIRNDKCWYIILNLFNFSPKLNIYSQSTCGAKSNTNKNANILRCPNKKPWVTWTNTKRLQNFPLLKFHPLSSDVTSRFIYDRLLKIVIQSMFTDPQVQVFQEQWMLSQAIQSQVIPWSLSFCPTYTDSISNTGPPVIISKCTSCQMLKMFDFFFFHDWPYFLMQACWQAILAYVFWTITSGPIHQLQPSLKSLYSSRNTVMIRGWKRGTLLNLSLSGGNTDMATIYYASSSWTIRRQVAPNLERIWHDLLRKQPPKLCKNPRESWKCHRGYRDGSWSLLHGRQ